MILKTQNLTCQTFTCLLLVLAIFRVENLPASTIRVKILVDEEEPGVEKNWQHRLQARLQRASDIISRYGGIRFAVSAYGSWDSDDRVNDFSRSLREFEHEVQPAPAHIVIGFTSQYRFSRGRHHLGGIRGPLCSHILIRESNPRIRESERVEVLVHELGHFLGAAHSAKPNSAMRPVVGDGLARARDFRIGFDPENAQVIRLVAREISNLNVRRFLMLSDATKRELQTHYIKLAKELPKDPVAPLYSRLIEKSLRATPTPSQKQPGPR